MGPAQVFYLTMRRAGVNVVDHHIMQRQSGENINMVKLSPGMVKALVMEGARKAVDRAAMVRLAKESCATAPAAPFRGAGLLGWSSRAPHCGARTRALRAVHRAVPPRQKGARVSALLAPKLATRLLPLPSTQARARRLPQRSGEAQRNAPRHDRARFQSLPPALLFPFVFHGRPIATPRGERRCCPQEKKKTNHQNFRSPFLAKNS